MSNPLEIALTIATGVALPCVTLLISVTVAMKLYRKEREDAGSAREEERLHAATARKEERELAALSRKEERLEIRMVDMFSALTSVAHYDPTMQSPSPVGNELRRAGTLLGNAVFDQDRDRATWISEICFQTERMLESAGAHIEVIDPDDPEREPDREFCPPSHPDAKFDEKELRDLHQWAELAMSFITQWNRSGQSVETGRRVAGQFLL